MGRRKISIAPIKDDRNRQVTFLKRKNGLFKKAYELGVLCSADVAVIVFNANGKLFEFHSGDMDQILLRYSHYAGPAHEKRGPEDYINKDLDAATKSGTGGKMTSLSDEDASDDDDDDDKPRVAAGSSGVRAIPQASKGKQAIRAQAERKAKGVEPSRSQSVEGGPSSERAGSFAGSSDQYHPHPEQQQQQQQHDVHLPEPPQDASHQQQQNGFALPGSLPFPFGGLPNLAGGPGGLPNLTGQMFHPFSPGAGMPSFPGFAGGLPSNFPFPMPAPFGFQGQQQPQQQQQPNGTSGPGSNGVPAWFGALNPGMTQGQPQAPHLQLLQQLGGMSGAMQGWPGVSMADPAAAMQAYQQQQQQQQQGQQHAPVFTSPFGQPRQPPPTQQYSQQQNGSPSSHPRPAPMYGTPAAMPPPPPPLAQQQQQQPQQSASAMYPASTPASSSQSDPHGSRPGSVASMHSHAQSNQSPAAPAAGGGGGGGGASHASPHLDGAAWQNKPRLSVAIPPEAGVREGTKPGLVTAGGASILGAGLGYGGGGQESRETHSERGGRGEGHETGEDDDVPKSAYAADLLPSPFYPNASAAPPSFGFLPGFGHHGAPAGSSAPQPFQWPTAPPPSAPEPAPPLGADDAPDLLRRGSFAELTSAAAAARAQAGELEERDGGGERGTKRGSGADEEGEEAGGQGAPGGRGRKRRG
ncbi:SRF-type transcription factor RlmA [Rhodotorula diobovata]|uniref:SRF-type transcription factor RlmA n=1 Tax=Rhodotorula diobovata TaxID=5288 RepID=A0A5C5FZ51_9BASI|nr:SRF-type transcription factor RlmA [Rhodotorula diobovata]